jgi:parallel beta-helix repeat protein
LANNNCSSNGGSGVEIDYTTNTSLVNNTCSNNYEGVVLSYSDDCSLIGNICSSNNYTGIRLGWSINDTLRHNENIHNGVFIDGYQLDFFNTHSIDTTNTANGKPIYYYKDSTDITVPAGAGEVVMVNCTDMRIENQVLSDSDVGIELAYCLRINVTNNTCSWNNQAGIYVYFSDYSSLIDNTCSSNFLTGNLGIFGSGIYLFYSANNSVIGNLCSGSRNGILLDGPMSDDSIFVNNNFSNNADFGLAIYPGGGSWTASNRCRIWNNTFDHNRGAGDTFNLSNIQAIDCGTGNWWNNTDGCGNYWSDWIQPDETPPFGIVDIPYLIEGWAETYDYYPLTAPHAPMNDSISTPSGGLLANPAVLFALAIAGVVVAVAIALLAIRRKKGPDQTIAKAEEPPTTPPGT